jgi:hypothetical protein
MVMDDASSLGQPLYEAMGYTATRSPMLVIAFD